MWRRTTKQGGSRCSFNSLAEYIIRILRHFVETTADMKDGAFSALPNLENSLRIVKDESKKTNKLYWIKKKK